MNEVGNRLRTLWKMHQLFQKQIAALIKTTQSAIYRYETDKAEPLIKTMHRCANYFDVSMEITSIGVSITHRAS